MLQPDSPAFPLHPLGTVRFFLRGRIFVGPDWRLLLVALVAEVVAALLFVLYTNEITAARVIAGILAPAVLVSLLTCSFSNPGIRPKEAPPPPNAPLHEPQVAQVVYVRPGGAVGCAKVELRWCYSCHRYRSLRSVHCRVCDVCVDRRDHHCPWTGICIGAGNYRSYVCLVWLAFAQMLTMFIGGVWSFIYRCRRLHSFGDAFFDTYCLEVLLIVAALGVALLTGSLSCFHAYLITKNRTSGDVARRVEEDIYDQGSICANIRESLRGLGSEYDREAVFHPSFDSQPVIVTIADETAQNDEVVHSEEGESGSI